MGSVFWKHVLFLCFDDPEFSLNERASRTVEEGKIFPKIITKTQPRHTTNETKRNPHRQNSVPPSVPFIIFEIILFAVEKRT
jgi:hypothetical protein